MLKSHIPYLLAAGFLLVAPGCGTVVIGQSCGGNGDCGGKHPACVAGLNNTAKICTHVCTSNQDCPFGYDCTVSNEALGRTCNKTLYAVDAKTGDPVLFGKPCLTDDAPCQGTADKNATPMCRKGNQPLEVMPLPLDSDPAGYCTGACTNDNDCPLPMKCAADYDGVTKCLKRQVCDECKYDEQCGNDNGAFRSDFTKCVPTRDGTSHYCSKPCLSDGDCPGAAKRSKWMVCQDSTSSDGTAGTYCLHWYGACVGMGNVCDPCRSQDDCGTGLKCIDNPYGVYSYPWSGERMCNKTCSLDTDCGGPNKSTCDADPNNGVHKCTDDPKHIHDGVFACNL
jgi:hypothetical protein